MEYLQFQNILITGRIYKEIQNIIESKKVKKTFRFLSEATVSPADFHWADVYVSFRPTANFEFGNVKWVHSLGAGVDSFLLDRQWKKDVLLTRTICSFGRKISEYCLSYMLRDLQLHNLFQRHQTQKQWKPAEPKELSSQKVVIYGTGEIGQEIARALSFFRASPLGVSLSGSAKPYFQKVVSAFEAGALLEDADWIISTLPLTKETDSLFNSDFFQTLNGASFINVGRGATVDEKALLEALQKGNLCQAVLDVFSEEPLPDASPLWEHPNVIITPHISAITSPEEAVECFLETLANIEAGNALSNRVSIEKRY